MVNRKKMDYQNGKIYCVRSYKTDLVYVGSTCQPLYKRLNEHKTNYKTYLKTGKTMYASYKIYELDDAPYIELIKKYPCSCLDELRREEGKFIRSIECANKNVAGRTKKEYREDNKEKIKEIQKKWNENNKDKVKEIKKKWNDSNKEYYSKYREKNKDKIKEQKKNTQNRTKKNLTKKQPVYVELLIPKEAKPATNNPTNIKIL